MAVNQNVIKQLKMWTHVEKSNKPIIGWRAWHWSREQPGLLRSLGVDFNWEGPHVKAHVKPYDMSNLGDDTGSRSGVYTVRRKYLPNVLYHYNAHAIGYGESWGRVAEFEKGWRAEHFMIRELFIEHPQSREYIPHWVEDITPYQTALENAFKCPVTFIKTIFLDKEKMSKVIDVIAESRKVDEYE